MSAKPLFVVLFFIFFLLVFANGTIGDADLSSGVQSQVPGVSTSGESGGGQNVIGKNSPCAGTYTVKPGDTLSKIAQSCKVALNDLLAVNPAIKNANLIAVGQKITIYKTASTAKPTATAKKGKATVTQTPTPTRIPGVVPGEKVVVEVNGLPPNAEVQVWISKVEGKAVLALDKEKTDKLGHLKVSVPVPENARAKENWIVMIKTVNRPKMTVTSAPFTIGSK